MEYLELGCAPSDEKCAQVGQDDYRLQAFRECNALRKQLRRMFGREPEKGALIIKGNPHDFGVYYEVRCYYEVDDVPGKNYAFRCEAEYPTEWDDEARKELGL